MKITDVGAAYDPQFERVEMSDNLREAAKAALYEFRNAEWDGWNPIIKKLEAALAETQMPTKICGPNLEETLNAAGFYRKKEWVGLTDDEINKEAKEKFVDYNFMSGFLSGASFAEAKLKEKNT